MKSSVFVKESYIVEDNRKKAVVIPIANYQKMLRKIEDMEDAIDALRAKKEAKDFFKYSDVKKELRAKGKL